jgi:hypothetical protein
MDYGLRKIWGNIFFKNVPKKWKKNAKVFETIKLNKNLMPKIQLKHSSWDSYTNVFLIEYLL